MTRLHTHSQTLSGHVFLPLLLLILVIIVLPSYRVECLIGKALVDEVCRHTSNDKYCVDTIIPKPPLSSEGIASTALGWAQIRALEAGSMIASLLKDSSILAVEPQQFQGLLQRCWDLNMNAMEDLWMANSLFYSKTIDAMVNYLYRAARDTRVCQDLIKGTSFAGLAAKNDDIIKLSEICVVSTKFFERAR